MNTVLLTIALLLANAFFVGAEFAAMSARRSQLEPLADDGSARARTALNALRRTGVLLATAQLGITICSVLIGAISEAALHHALVPVMERVGLGEAAADVVALLLALLVVVYLHVVVGEMIPKNISIATPERAAIILVPPLAWLSRAAGPIINAMDRVSKWFVSAAGVEPKDEVASTFTAEEVAHILDESREEGLVEDEDYERLGAALEFSGKCAADVAVVPDKLVTVSVDATPADLERLVAKHGYSRYPVARADGELAGYLHLKDVLYADESERTQPIPAKRVRAMATVASGDEVEQALAAMRGDGTHLARVVDAEGGIRGVVFLEDVLEELVGEVRDATQRDQRQAGS